MSNTLRKRKPLCPDFGIRKMLSRKEYQSRLGRRDEYGWVLKRISLPYVSILTVK